jgi:hypothetical protein
MLNVRISAPVLMLKVRISAPVLLLNVRISAPVMAKTNLQTLNEIYN